MIMKHVGVVSPVFPGRLVSPRAAQPPQASNSNGRRLVPPMGARGPGELSGVHSLQAASGLL